MSYDNQGGLWDNQKKYNASDPDFVGSITIGGVKHKLVAWKSSSTHPQSPTINIKLNQGVPQVVGFMPNPETKDKDDDIPF